MYETVEDLAQRLDMPVDKLLADLQSAGLPVSNVHDIVSQSDQVKLQRYREAKTGSGSLTVV
ncbi:translation initiation factor IF-2 N-terminal domain-containing protein [Rhodanobacter spathiphylli]|uniref:translation initiation factor IF-2 N-terminal domain-containing protein n=1 Tax=Rhodanobacter spathiphylli TaxID=347483 RepID=UPI003CCDCFB5